jgi:hypothetical protein
MSLMEEDEKEVKIGNALGAQVNVKYATEDDCTFQLVDMVKEVAHEGNYASNMIKTDHHSLQLRC